MHVAFVTPEFPLSSETKSGGIGTSIYYLSKGLIKANCRVTIVLLNQPEKKILDFEGIKIFTFPHFSFRPFSRIYFRYKLQGILDKLVESEGIDIVEFPDWQGYSAFISTKCTKVVRCNGSGAYFRKLLGQKVWTINSFFEMAALRQADGIASVSSFTADVTSKLFKIRRERFTIINNSIDFDKLNSLKSNIEDEKIILYFGTIIAKKGVLEIPFIFNYVNDIDKDIRLLIVGKDTSFREEGNKSGVKLTSEKMKSLFTEHALKNVEFLGSKPLNEVYNYINAASVVLLPSYAEALPLTWLETMAMGKVLIGSNIGWAKEIIQNEINGFMFYPTQHKEISECIISLINNKEMMMKIGTNAEQRARAFSSDRINKQNLEFYRSLLKEQEKSM